MLGICWLDLFGCATTRRGPSYTANGSRNTGRSGVGLSSLIFFALVLAYTRKKPRQSSRASIFDLCRGSIFFNWLNGIARFLNRLILRLLVLGGRANQYRTVSTRTAPAFGWSSSPLLRVLRSCIRFSIHD